MKSRIILGWSLLAGVTSLLSCSGSGEGYVINGVTDETAEGKIYLCEYVGKKYQVRDSAKISAGRFSFEGSVVVPSAYTLTADTLRRRQPVFFLENADIDVAIDDDGVQMSVEGSPLNDFYAANLAAAEAGTLDIDSLASANPQSAVVPYLMQRYYSWRLSLDEMQQVRAKFDNMLDANPSVREIDSLINRLSQLQVGAKAPDFQLPDTAGVMFSLSSLKGSFVLLDFWASWCPDCRKENPDMVKINERFAPRGLKMVGLSLDKERDKWISAIKRDGLDWLQLSDLNYWDSPVAETYAVKWIPQNYLIDPTGTIVARSLSPDSLAVVLDRMLPRK